MRRKEQWGGRSIEDGEEALRKKEKWKSRLRTYHRPRKSLSFFQEEVNHSEVVISPFGMTNAVQISNFDDLHEEDEKGQKSQLCPIILATFSSHRRRHIFTGLLFINVNPNLSIVYLLFHDTCMLISPSTHTLSRLSFRSSRSKVQPKPTPVILPVILQGNIICPNEEG